MSGNTKKHRVTIILLLLLVVLSAGIDACGRSAENQSRYETAPLPDHKHPHLVHTSEPPTQTSSTVGQVRRKYQLAPSELGRENPFMPLIVKHSDRNRGATDRSARVNPDGDGSIADPVIRLTAIINETKAIIEEGGISRSISVGDTIARMKVVEIRRGKIILDKKDRRYTIKLGVLPESITKGEL